MPLDLDASRRRALFAALAMALAATAAPAAEPAAASPPRVRFASVAEGRAVLGADDAWVAATSDFQRSATLGVPPPVSRDAFLAFLAGTARPWPESQARRWQRAVDTVMARATALQVPMPAEIVLVNSDGRDASNAPYTRDAAIVLPTDALPSRDPDRTDPFLVAHELFHVVSRHDPALADRLYALVGFERVEPLQWPAAWRPIRIANPDAPHDRHAMRLAIDGREAIVMPVLIAGRTDLRPGESFFKVMELRLLEVTASPGAPTLPVLRGGEPAWHEPRKLPGFVARLGGNSNYIIHPEEVLADNFAQLVTGRTVPNPALLQQIEAELRAPR